MFREAVRATNDRLNAGEKATDVPCPKCQQERGIVLEPLGQFKSAVCGICAFHWVVN
jgi:predicted RNA-binding Zn-ribbon protein involved in translation (DUF1610 family)